MLFQIGFHVLGDCPFLLFSFQAGKGGYFLLIPLVVGCMGAPYCEIKCNVLYAHYLPTKKVHRRKVGESHRLYSLFVVDASWTIISSEP